MKFIVPLFSALIVYVFVSGPELAVFNKAALYDKAQPMMTPVMKSGKVKKLGLSGPMRQMLKGAGYNY